MWTAGRQGDSLEAGGSGHTQSPTHALVDGQQDQLLAGRQEGEMRGVGVGGQESPMRDGCWPGLPAPQLDAVTISGRKSIANHPNTGVEIFLRVFNALKGLLQQFLNLHSQREKKKMTTAIATVI